jgi:DNA-binding XRE family transcriptional regulator
MTPSTLRRAVEEVAGELPTVYEARCRGIVLGRVVAQQLRAKGLLADRRAGREFEQVLQQMAASGDELLSVIATNALGRIRFEQNQVRRQTGSGTAIAPAQCRQARELLGWTQDYLGEKLGVAGTVIGLFERGHQLPHTMKERQDRAEFLRTILETAGVEFTNGDEPGVKLRKTDQ